MIKYSAPSIEVVSFNSSDAPRIGMQWWVRNTGTHDPAPWTWTALPGWAPTGTIQPKEAPFDATGAGVPCASVMWYGCPGESIPAGIDTSESQWTSQAGVVFEFVLDDGRSC